jgi:hypothetical protein
MSGEKGSIANKNEAILAFWRCNKDGTPSNGGSGNSRYPGYVEEIPGPLKLCTKNALHATMEPQTKWIGEKIFAVALYPPIAFDDNKMGSLKREILCEVPNFF